MDQSLFNPKLLDARSSKSAQVYEVMRDAIISLRLAPDAPILEREISAQLGVSRTPLREAILQLANESLVRIAPSDGTFVNRILLSEVLQGQLVRDTIEMRLTRLAARNFTEAFEKDFQLALFQQSSAAKRQDVDEFFALDNQFHRLICSCAGFPEAWQTIHGATGQLDRCRRLAFSLEAHYSTVFDEHTAMFEMLKTRNEDGVAEVFQAQLDSTFPSFDILRRERPDVVAGGDTDFDIRRIH
ncbi:GntR family transcriptional regulator protein (plasmid) [Rhizobium phaseoli]|uniref:GntR family transcriptional regulator n=1 Tax=Rhizobium phaseoli TaxID=396 RepID=UPI0007F149C6|nr:GntR family transcriptional regulator [Rhizobium phaseoli]ANL51039.1 GntR family transcriptional regulator protein [Rhizobium phaseoli]